MSSKERNFLFTLKTKQKMKYLKIKNDGVLDIRLVALMGGTTKANKEHLIGNFGSGLKYTLAFLIRNNLSFKIFAGTEPIDIGTETEIIRDETFDIICINNKRTSITANMGNDWLAWMIVRELWSNALDEGGAEKQITTDVIGHDGCTTFYIQIDSQIQDVINNWGKYFIHEETPLCETSGYKIYGGGKSLRLYKQGVLIYEDVERPAMFSYDIACAELNELREFKGGIDYSVTEALSRANEVVIKYFLENITEHYYEGGDMCYGYNWIKWNENWRNCIGNAKIITAEVIKAHAERGMKIDTNDYITLPKPVFKALTQAFEGISALRIAKDGQAFYENYDEKLENRIKQGLAILEACEYPFHPEIEFRYGFFEDKKTQATIQFDSKIICVSQSMLQRPIFNIVAMLIEENEHLNTGLQDETRAFQQHFIDLYTKTLLSSNQVPI